MGPRSAGSPSADACGGGHPGSPDYDRPGRGKNGWEALQAAATELVGAGPAAVVVLNGEGGVPALDACEVFDAGDHWLYVTFGLCDLFEPRQLLAPGISGWGYEMTFRVAYSPEDETFPSWPVVLLARLAELTVHQSRTFTPGDTVDPGGPIDGRDGGRLVGLLVAPDPGLAPVETTAGTVELRTFFGVTMEQLRAAQGGQASQVVRALRSDNPLLVTSRPASDGS